MITTADGHNLYFYLEGVRVPPLNITINTSRMLTSATIDIFAHETAKDIKDCSLGAVFYSKGGLKERRLLFFGFLNTKNYSKQNGMHTVSLTFLSRSAFLSRLHTGIVGNGSYSSCSTQATTKTTNPASVAEQNAAVLGSGIFTSPVTLKASENIEVNTQGSEASAILKDGIITTQADHPVNEDMVKVKDTKTSIKPFGKIINNVKYTYPVKSIMDKIIQETCNTSGVFNKIAYEDRYLLKNYISEMPGGWGEYFFGDSRITSETEKSKARNNTSFLNVFHRYLQKLGTTSSVADIYMTLLGLLMMEAWEIPGLVDSAHMIAPESIYTDLPMCNIIWPDMCTAIAYNEDSSKRISRLIFSSRAVDTDLNENRLKLASDLSATSLGVFPPTDVIINKPEGTIAKSFNNIIYDTEVYNGSMQQQTQLPIAYLRGLSPRLLTDLAKYAYNNASTAYSSCQLSMHFFPELIPGLNAVVNDGMWKGVGRVVAIRHSFSPGSPATTSVSLSNYKKLEDYEYDIPSWYSNRYNPDKVDDLYYTKFGVNSIGAFLKNPGVKLSVLIDKLNEMYESTSVRSVMAEKLSQRYFMSQDGFFERVKATGSQQDDKGVVIYKGKIFKPISYDTYDIDGNPNKTTADRQSAVVKYLKAIYGRPAVKV